MALFGNPLYLLAAAAVLATLALFLVLGRGNRSRVTRRVDRLRARLIDRATSTDLKLKRNIRAATSLDRIFRHILPRPELLRQRLHRTGRHIGLGSYGLACMLLALASGTGIRFIGFAPIMAVFGGILIGLWLPHMVVGFLVKRRATRFTVLFPEAIGLMIRGIKSGLPITESFQIVGREIPDPVGKEFRQICDQIRVGQPIDQILWDAARRVGTPEMQFLVVTLSVQRETGGNLAETLENLDNILRRRRQMKLKVKAMSSEAKASAMIIGALPFIMGGMLLIVNRDYMSLLFTAPLGHILLGCGAASISIGIGVMAKMVRFNI